MKYTCLVLDHDDTVVNSTPSIHYPAFLATLKVLRPQAQIPTLEEFYRFSFAPGYWRYCREVLGFSDADLQTDSRIWTGFVDQILPSPIQGMQEVLNAFRARGGRICVVSHSEKRIIQRDFLRNFGFVPDQIHGAEDGPGRVKPSAYPLQEIAQTLSVPFSQMVMVDDLRPGLDMAEKCGVDFVAAGWAHKIPELEQYLRSHAVFYARTPTELGWFLFDDGQSVQEH